MPSSRTTRPTIRLATMAAVVLAAVIAITPFAQAATTDVLVSQGKPVTASSSESAAVPAGAAVDGNSGTRWGSAFTASQWLQVDLGAVTPVARITISWEAAYAKAFTIRFSTDGSTYSDAFATTTGAGGQQNVTVSGTARFVRIELTTRALSSYGYSIYEFQVFSGDSTPSGAGIGSISLINDATHLPILGLSPLVDGSKIDLTRLANKNLSLQAALAPGAQAGSVAFTLSGAKGTSASRTENTAPYFLCNDFVDCPLLVTPDSYTLTVQAYASADAAGAKVGAADIIHFTVSDTAVAPPALDVLYIGNSLIGTATGATGQDTPALVQKLAADAGRTVHTTEVIHFGNTLKQTWDSGESSAALTGSKKYDYIVLQEYSTLVATDLPSATSALLDTYAPTFAGALKPGGKVILFKDWALVDPAPFATRAANVDAINTNYAALSASLPTPHAVAPISDEFEKLIAANGPSYLIVSDGKHPNDTAIYLDAATLYGILFAESPRKLSNEYLPATTATSMRDVAATQIGY
jgi:hypothetical protein